MECLETNVYLTKDLYFGDIIKGPALILQDTSTIVIEPECQAYITENGNIRINLNLSNFSNTVTDKLDRIQLAIFAHRFMSIAEQMGKILQKTSISTNIKERLDFSCAVFGPRGGLVANAPHLPVHLGSMQEAVRFQIRSSLVISHCLLLLFFVFFLCMCIFVLRFCERCNISNPGNKKREC